MSANVVNQMPYLRTTREFPEEIRQLTVEINKSYLDIANVVNNRTIGLYPTTRPAITGESYFIRRNERQQTFRQVYVFTTTASIAHGISIIDPNQFTLCFGSYTDGTNSYGLIFGTSVAIAGQISFYITATQIVFVVGAGAPALTAGKIVLHWLSQP
jgi:hypothetical protein